MCRIRYCAGEGAVPLILDIPISFAVDTVLLPIYLYRYSTHLDPDEITLRRLRDPHTPEEHQLDNLEQLEHADVGRSRRPRARGRARRESLPSGRSTMCWRARARSPPASTR